MNISIIIPVFNAENFVRMAVESALYHEVVKEVILVEDGSTDTSLKICDELSDKYEKVKLFRHENGINKGAGASRNLGILNASQVFISFLDADDTFTSLRFEKEAIIFKENADCDSVYGAIGVNYLDEVGVKAWEQKGNDSTSLTTVNKIIAPNILFDYLVGYLNNNDYKGYFSIISLTVKRSRLLKSRILFNEHLRLHQDSFFIFQLSSCLNLYTGEISKPVAMRGVHAKNRYLQALNLKKSQSLVDLELRNWAMEVELDNSYIKHFNKQYFIKQLQSTRKRYRLCKLVKLLFLDKVMRNLMTLNMLKQSLKLMI